MPDSPAESLMEEAQGLKDSCLYASALSVLKKALRSCKGREDSLGCLLSLGDTYRMTGGFEEAAGYYRQAITLSSRLRDPRSRADAEVGLALSLRALGRWKEALNLMEKVAKFYKKEGDKEGVAFTLWAKAGALRVKGDIGEAIKTFKKSLRAFTALGEESGVGYCLCGLGGTTRIKGKSEESLAYYMAANELFSGLKDTFGKAYSYCGIGNALRMAGDYKAALANFKKAARLYERIGDIVSYSYTLWSTGKTLLAIGKLREAEAAFKEADALFKRTKDPRGRIYAALGLSEVKSMRGEDKKAESLALWAAGQAEEYGFRVEACHARFIASYLVGKPDRRCYNKLGLKLGLKSLPFDIP